MSMKWQKKGSTYAGRKWWKSNAMTRRYERRHPLGYAVLTLVMPIIKFACEPQKELAT